MGRVIAERPREGKNVFEVVMRDRQDAQARVEMVKDANGQLLLESEGEYFK